MQTKSRTKWKQVLLTTCPRRGSLDKNCSFFSKLFTGLEGFKKQNYSFREETYILKYVY